MKLKKICQIEVSLFVIKNISRTCCGPWSSRESSKRRALQTERLVSIATIWVWVCTTRCRPPCGRPRWWAGWSSRRDSTAGTGRSASSPPPPKHRKHNPVNGAIHKAAGSLATGRSQKACGSNDPEAVPAGSSHSQPMGHFSVEWWNSGIVPIKLWNGW